MLDVVHVVATANFAGVERYVCNVAGETARRGSRVTVVGGAPDRMRRALPADVRFVPAGSGLASLVALMRLGRHDICHAHMTVAEAVSVLARPAHRAPIVATRHFAAPRGATVMGGLAAPWIAARLRREIAVSRFVAERLERRPDAVVESGVPATPSRWRPESRVVLVLQRIDPEKDTLTAVRAWQLSRLAEQGWTMRIVGEGRERGLIETFIREQRVSGVEIAGWSSNVDEELSRAGVLLAPATAEPFGLGVVEAMAAGVPVVACAAGGHLETVGRVPDALMFAPHDAPAAAAALSCAADDERRRAASEAGRELVERCLTISRHVDALYREYEAAIGLDG